MSGKEMVSTNLKENCIDFTNKDGEVILRVDNNINVLEVSSETGTIKLNGYELHRLRKLNIQMDGYNNVKMMADMDVDEEKILLLIKGEVKWFEGIDRENYLHGQ